MRNVLKGFIFFLVCFFLVLSVTASPIPAGTHLLTGVAAGASPQGGAIALNANVRAMAADRISGVASFGAATMSGPESTGNSPTVHTASVSDMDGRAPLYSVGGLNSSGDTILCDAGSGCVASSVQIANPGDRADVRGSTVAVGTGRPTAMPEMSTWTLVMTGLMMIAGVLVVRPATRPGKAAGSV